MLRKHILLFVFSTFKLILLNIKTTNNNDMLNKIK